MEAGCLVSNLARGDGNHERRTVLICRYKLPSNSIVFGHLSLQMLFSLLQHLKLPPEC